MQNFHHNEPITMEMESFQDAAFFPLFSSHFSNLTKIKFMFAKLRHKHLYAGKRFDIQLSIYPIFWERKGQ